MWECEYLATAANPNTTSGYLANSNTTRGEVLTKWIGLTEVARSHHQHRNGYRVSYEEIQGLLDMCPCVWIGLCPNMYLPRTGVYPPRAHILDPWGRAILHAPTHTLGWMYTPISTLGSLGMGVEWGLPHWLLVVSDLDQRLEFLEEEEKSISFKNLFLSFDHICCYFLMLK